MIDKDRLPGFIKQRLYSIPRWQRTGNTTTPPAPSLEMRPRARALMAIEEASKENTNRTEGRPVVVWDVVCRLLEGDEEALKFAREIMGAGE